MLSDCKHSTKVKMAGDLISPWLFWVVSWIQFLFAQMVHMERILLFLWMKAFVCKCEHSNANECICTRSTCPPATQPWLFDFQGPGAQKQRVNRRIRMPAIFQKVNGQSLWTASGKDKTMVKKIRKIEMHKDDSCNCSHKTCTQTTTTQSWSSGKLEARKEKEAL